MLRFERGSRRGQVKPSPLAVRRRYVGLREGLAALAFTYPRLGKYRRVAAGQLALERSLSMASVAFEHCRRAVTSSCRDGEKATVFRAEGPADYLAWGKLEQRLSAASHRNMQI